MSKFSGVAAIATMHAKGLAIGPILEEHLQIKVVTALGIDTDALGTFTGEIARQNSAKEAAIEKARLALQHIPIAKYGLGSEGSFGPSLYFPFIASGYEIVVLLSRDESVQIFGYDLTTETNCFERIVDNLEDALESVGRFDFPRHAAVIQGVANDKEGFQGRIIKGITSLTQLKKEIKILLDEYEKICIQSDMRANYNPTRMSSIQRAAIDLAKNANSCCPSCSHPGYVVVETIKGLPCSACGEASDAIASLIYVCVSCSYRETRPRHDGKMHVDPGSCCYCNP